MIRWAPVVVAACSDATAPYLDSATPASASANATVELAGRHLCGPRGDCATAGGEVQIGLAQPIVVATIVSYTDAAVQVQIPSITPVGATSLVVTVNDRASNALAFEVLP